LLPDPLHPAIVHLPIALALLVPLVALFALAATRLGFVPVRGWAFVVLLQGLLVGSAWMAIETGEDQEERVEKVVAERHIEDHEERAERLLIAAGVALVVIGAGLAPGRVGSVARPLGLVLSLGVAALAADVGHSGGLLVYEHGAAAAYTNDSPPAPPR
jgi:uncharacterized membrane protein